MLTSLKRSRAMARGGVALLIGTVVLLSGCTGSQPTAKQSSAAEETNTSAAEETNPSTDNNADGPHSPKDRTLADLSVETSSEGVTTAHFDLGDTEVGEYRAPIRGILITPAASTAKTPLIIVNHLRFPGCEDGVFAYPCANGVKERRMDQGMEYFGQAMAAQGYSVLIPDLAPAWVGSDVKSPYDQDQMWTQILTRMMDEVKNTSGNSTLAAKAHTENIDTSRIGLVLHSRSGTLVNPAVNLFGKDTIQGVLAYGPAYDTYDEEHMSDDIPDVPYFAISGDEDQDVGSSANLWRGYYLSTKRQNPSLTANVPGYGHMFINRALNTAELDDRIGCEQEGAECADAKAHEKLLIEAAQDWFGWAFAADRAATTSSIPVQATDEIPTKLADVPARWLAATNQQTTTRLGPDDFTATKGSSVEVCVPADPMNPNRPKNACPEVEDGVVDIAFATPINVLDGGRAEVSALSAKNFALHLAPYGTSAPPSDAQVTLTFEYDDGSTKQVKLDPKDAALRNRSNATSNGYYVLTTLRGQVPQAAGGAKVVAVSIKADRKLALAGIDLLAGTH